MTDRQLIVGIVAVVLLAAAVWVSWLLRQRRQQAWSRFARHHGLRPVPTAGDVDDFAGTVGGRAVALRQADHGSDTGTLGVTVVSLGIELAGEPPRGLHVEPGTVLDPLLMPEREDEPVDVVETGDEDFDGRVRVRAEDPVAARTYLTGARRRAILRLLEEYPSSDSGIREGSVWVAMREVLADDERLDDCLALLLTVAPTLDGDADPGPEDTGRT